MILNNAVNTGPFIYCMAYFAPHENHSYYNSGDGHHHQWTYVLDGSAEIVMGDPSDPIYSNNSNVPGTLFDHSEYKDMYHNIKTINNSLSLINFNPVPATRDLLVDIVKGPCVRAVTTTSKRVTVVCITGPIMINDKELVSLQHAKIFSPKTATLNLPDNTICALVSDK